MTPRLNPNLSHEYRRYFIPRPFFLSSFICVSSCTLTMLNYLLLPEWIWDPLPVPVIIPFLEDSSSPTTTTSFLSFQDSLVINLRYRIPCKSFSMSQKRVDYLTFLCPFNTILTAQDNIIALYLQLIIYSENSLRSLLYKMGRTERKNKISSFFLVNKLYFLDLGSLQN